MAGGTRVGSFKLRASDWNAIVALAATELKIDNRQVVPNEWVMEGSVGSPIFKRLERRGLIGFGPMTSGGRIYQVLHPGVLDKAKREAVRRLLGRSSITDREVIAWLVGRDLGA